MFGLFVFLIALRRFSTACDGNLIIMKLQDKIEYSLFFNSTFKYILEGYLILTLESLILMKNGLDWSNELNIKQALFAITTMTICVIAPLGMTIFFTIRFNQFRDKKFLLRYSSVIGDYNFREKLSSFFISIFCYRRLVMSLLIVLLPSYPNAQVQLMT